MKHLPKGMDIEYQLMKAFVNGKEPISALRSISINIRRLFVHAYQAYIFNRCLSHAIVNGENILHGNSGDLCFEMEGPCVWLPRYAFVAWRWRAMPRRIYDASPEPSMSLAVDCSLLVTTQLTVECGCNSVGRHLWQKAMSCRSLALSSSFWKKRIQRSHCYRLTSLLVPRCAICAPSLAVIFSPSRTWQCCWRCTSVRI